MTAVFSLSATESARPFAARNQRILALAFPRLSTDRIARRRWGLSWRSAGRPERPPVVCAGRSNNAVRLTALDEAAEALGLKRDQGLSEACAICPGLDVLEEDRAADRRFLEGIADWCDRYTPLVAFDGDDGLFLDITGCAHLFGGEKALLKDVLFRLFQLGLDGRGAIASSPGLSSAVCRFGAGGVIADTDIQDVLSPLPVASLRLEVDTVAALHKLGLRQVGDLLTASRAPLARRFGTRLLLRLDQALCLDEEPISPRRPVASLSAERRLAEPVQAEEDVLNIAGLLAQTLKPGLEARGVGGRLFELLLFRVDGEVTRIVVGASQPLREPRRIDALFCERIKAVHDDLDAGFGFEILRLNVLQHQDFDAVQGDFAGKGDADQSLAAFVDQVAARLGPDCLQTFELRESHVPERASVCVSATRVPLAARLHKAADTGHVGSERPLRLLPVPERIETFAVEVPEGPPIRFFWRRTLRRVERAEGPERLAPEWWIDGEDAPARDYFRVEDEAGRRYWLFREGAYGQSLPSPRWFIHGIFA
jgi:protein ImuB